MTLLAILQRELRLEARRPHNYWLRVLGAALMAFVFMGLVTRDDKSAALLGARLFPHFHIILSMANSRSSGNWQLKQPVAMALPAVILKAGGLRCWAACFLPGRVAG